MNNSARTSIRQVSPSISLNSLFDSNLVAFAIIDSTGQLLQMNSLFSSISCIQRAPFDQNVYSFGLFNCDAFRNQLDSLNNKEIHEFTLSRYVECQAGIKKYVKVKAIRANKDVPEQGILIMLEETASQCSIEEVIQIIGNSLERSKDDYFFDTMCHSLSESLGIGMVFVGEYIKNENLIKSISFWNKNKFESEVSYPVDGTPTEVVMKTNSIRFYQKDIQEHFPNDPSLAHWNVNSYIGCPLLNSQGEFVGYIGIMDSNPIQNIPLVQSVLHIYSHSLGRELERMNQKKKIEHGELRYKAIYEQSPFGIIVSSKNGKLTANPRFCEMLGYSKSEISELKRKDITHPEDLDVHLELLEAAKKSNIRKATFRKRYIKKNGKICYAKVSVSNIFHTPENNTDNFVLVEDITDRLNREKLLRDNQKLTKNIIETAQDAVITFDHNDKVIEWNKQAELTFGYTKVEAKQMSFSQFVDIKFDDAKKSPTLKEFVKTYKGKMTIERMEVTAKGKDGKIFPAELSLSPIKVNDCYVYSTFIRDITTHKKYQNILNQNLVELNEKNKQLRKYIDSNLQLENFAHIASHDLKEPLRSIGNFSQLLNKRLENKLNDTEKEFFGFILTGVQNMSQLIEDLLLYSSVNNQQTPIKELNLNDTLFVVSRNLHKAIEDNQVQLNISEMPNSFFGSDTKLKQLFQNLIANAIKFKKKEAETTPIINVNCIDIGEYWHFKIEDNGIGIKDEFKDKIFKIFKKLHAKTEYQGTGIGLAVCKTIVDQHHGEIWVDSEFGVGTTFNFTLSKNKTSQLT